MASQSIKNYIIELFKIASPIIMGNLGFILIGLGDVVVAGRYSTDTFASISIANSIMNCILTFGIGLIAGISPLLSNYRGEKRTTKKYFYPSIRFAMILACVVGVLLLATIPLIPKMGFEPRLNHDIQVYMLINTLSIFGGYLHACVKEFLQAFEIVMFPNLLTLFCVFLNLFLNIIFVFGFGIIPSMGTVGLAWASFITRYFMGIVLLIYCFKMMRFENYHEKGYYKSLIKIGFPVSLAVFIEFVAFNSIAIVMGRISGIYAAVQNLICTLTTLTFMIPFALSNAVAVKVGFANGCKNLPELKTYAKIAVCISIIFMACCGILYGTFPRQIVGIFTVDEKIFNVALPLMYILSVFQVFDGLQVTLSGICKGLKTTNIVLLSNFIAYWCIALPIGFILAFKFNMNITGFWIGLVISSFCLCCIMATKLVRHLKRQEKGLCN